MNDHSDGLAWLYSGGRWQLTGEPITLSDSDDVEKWFVRTGDRNPAGRPGARASARAFLVIGPGARCSGDNTPAPRLSLFVRPWEQPECQIFIEGLTAPSRSVYAASLPDGLDLMARWAPIITTPAA